MSEATIPTPPTSAHLPTYGELVDRSWKTLKGQLPLTAALTLVTVILYGTINRATNMMGFLYAASMVAMILNAFVATGYVACLYRIKNKEQFGFEDFFWAFRGMERALNVIVMAALTAVLTVVGYVLLIVPGIWVTVVLTFSTVLIVRDKKSGVEAMQDSRELVRGRWWWTAGLLGMIFLINMLGALCFVVGLLFSIPVSILMIIQAAEVLGKPAPAGDLGADSIAATPSTFAVNP